MKSRTIGIGGQIDLSNIFQIEEITRFQTFADFYGVEKKKNDDDANARSDQLPSLKTVFC